MQKLLYILEYPILQKEDDWHNSDTYSKHIREYLINQLGQITFFFMKNVYKKYVHFCCFCFYKGIDLCDTSYRRSSMFVNVSLTISSTFLRD